MKMKNNFCLVINSCDSYSSCWNPFFTLLEKYYPNHPKTYLICENKKCDYCETINIKNQIWTERYKKALEQIKEKYVLTMLDDFFIREYVDEERIINILTYFKPNIACFNFEDKYILPCENVSYNGFKLRKNNTLYLNSCQPSIHDRLKLIERLSENKTPQEWELALIDSPYEFYVNDDKPIINIGYDHTLNWGISRGKITKECLQFLKSENIDTKYLEDNFK